jgi:nucleotide-binding universal stress UspA family protein
MFGKILHANDGSEHAFRALALALAIAKQNRSEVHIVCVASNRVNRDPTAMSVTRPLCISSLPNSCDVVAHCSELTRSESQARGDAISQHRRHRSRQFGFLHRLATSVASG